MWQNAAHIPLWRWSFFLAWAIPMYRITRVVIYLIMAALEYRFFVSRRFIYYTIGIKVGRVTKCSQFKGARLLLQRNCNAVCLHATQSRAYTAHMLIAALPFCPPISYPVGNFAHLQVCSGLYSAIYISSDTSMASFRTCSS